MNLQWLMLEKVVVKDAITSSARSILERDSEMSPYAYAVLGYLHKTNRLINYEQLE